MSGIKGTNITGVHTLIVVVKVAPNHVEICWISVHWHQDHRCVAPNGQKREICWHYARKETSLQRESGGAFKRSMMGSLVVDRDLQRRTPTKYRVECREAVD